jgi:hypothetical protein
MVMGVQHIFQAGKKQVLTVRRGRRWFHSIFLLVMPNDFARFSGKCTLFWVLLMILFDTNHRYFLAPWGFSGTTI